MHNARLAHHVNLDDPIFQASSQGQQLRRLQAEVRSRLHEGSVAVDSGWLSRLQDLWDRLSAAPLGPDAARIRRPALPDLLELADGVRPDLAPFEAGIIVGLLAALETTAFPNGLVPAGGRGVAPVASAPADAPEHAAETEMICPFCQRSVSLQQPICPHCNARRIRRFDMLLSAPFAAFNWFGGVLVFFLAGPVWVALAWDSLRQPSALQAFPMGKLGLFCGAALTLAAIPLYRGVRRLLDRLFGEA